jgi:tRNA dimethylallyltransferase
MANRKSKIVNRKSKLLIICGPTATGKTALAAMLANKFNGELISADSRQVYKEMDVCTGKDRPACAGGPDVPIWLYDVVNPNEEFSVSHWVRLAKIAIADILKRNKLPIVVGGTGLYINALIHPFDTINIPPDSKLRIQLSTLSKEQLQEKLQKFAPNVWKELNISDRNNPRRLIRKIEISKSKIVSLTKVDQYDSLIIGLTAPLETLDKRIEDRFKKRVRQGMKKEIEKLLKKYSNELPSMSAIGLNEHAYARRQMTWFKKQPDIQWFSITVSGYQRDVTAEVLTWYTKDG